MEKKNILIIDDDPYICKLLENFLERKGYSTLVAVNVKSAIQTLKSKDVDFVLCDFRLPDGDGLKVLNYIRKNFTNLPVIIMTAYADIRQAVKLIKAGAFDYITKPVYPDEITKLIEKGMAKSGQNEVQLNFEKNFIAGESEQIKQVLEQVRMVAPTNMTVLLEGETGSGKEYIARAIHHNSRRRNNKFIAIDCGAIPKELANSELFGHVKGAFTGALNDKKGYFEIANKGTIFLDEIGNLSIENQIKLLRVIQERVINKVGENKDIVIDVRIIVATNEELKEEVEKGNFREDLFHRVNEFKIRIPPLRERPDDILAFANFFLKKSNEELERNITGFDDQVMKAFYQYPWYGNIRELRNVIKRSVLLSRDNIVTVDTLPGEITEHEKQDKEPVSHFPSTPVHDPTDLKAASSEAEKTAIIKALEETGNNKSRAAQLLNIDRKTLYNKLRQFNLES
jgi:two-component system, NtrC family, response regulator HydG